ncbi:phosphotransferase enzyme family protein [Zymoseptoria brevis]|uniref:Phosphotransferase enzyme family protein n=1 Tax=Zymoseptoria brevis TaxID=1047168 RepID=A0A0F4GHA3_9PEZI|nr:phosphotransferase enzyme family protein [Zymoseptoria brevis]
MDATAEQTAEEAAQHSFAAIQTPIEVHLEDLPSNDDCTFTEEFKLPSPAEVRARAEEQGIDILRSFRPDPVIFPELRLLVKWGEDISIAEGQTIRFISKNLQTSVPVPQIHGWKTDGDQTFLYMELVAGDTLSSRWPDLSASEKDHICDQLRTMLQSWRRIVQSPSAQGGPTLSALNGHPLRDILFSDALSLPTAPFTSVSAFHDHLATFISGTRSRPEIPELHGLNDSAAVVFTHSDLDQSNILVSAVGDVPVRIVAVIDWHQSGWYTEHWEALKAMSVGEHGSEWVEKWLPKVVGTPDEGYHYAFEFISLAVL